MSGILVEPSFPTLVVGPGGKRFDVIGETVNTAATLERFGTDRGENDSNDGSGRQA